MVIIISFGIAFLVNAFTFRHGLVFLGLFATLMIYGFIWGKQTNGAQERSVGTLFKQLTGWIMPTGLSWWFPPPFGGSVLKQGIAQRKLDRTREAGKALTAVNTHNNNQVTISYLALYAATDLSKFVKITDGDAAFAALMDRSVRFYVNYWESDGPNDIADQREDFSKFLMSDNGKTTGDKTTFSVPALDGTPATAGTSARKIIHSDVAAEAAKMGITIFSVRIDDVDSPESIRKAREAEAAEAAEAAKEKANAASLTNRMRELKNAFPGLSDAEVLNAIQAEKGSVKTIRVDGNAGDFTKGAALGATLGGDKK